jgi:hypothetical protein
MVLLLHAGGELPESKLVVAVAGRFAGCGRLPARAGSVYFIEAGSTSGPSCCWTFLPGREFRDAKPLSMSLGVPKVVLCLLIETRHKTPRQNDFHDEMRLTSGALRGLASSRPEPQVLEAQTSGEVSHGRV